MFICDFFSVPWSERLVWKGGNMDLKNQNMNMSCGRRRGWFQYNKTQGIERDENLIMMCVGEVRKSNVLFFGQIFHFHLEVTSDVVSLWRMNELMTWKSK